MFLILCQNHFCPLNLVEKSIIFFHTFVQLEIIYKLCSVVAVDFFFHFDILLSPSFVLSLIYFSWIFFRTFTINVKQSRHDKWKSLSSLVRFPSLLMSFYSPLVCTVTLNCFFLFVSIYNFFLHQANVSYAEHFLFSIFNRQTTFYIRYKTIFAVK